MRKDVLVEKRRRFEQNDVVRWELGEEVVVYRVEEVFSMSEGFFRSVFSCSCVIGKYVDDDDVVLAVVGVFDVVERVL